MTCINAQLAQYKNVQSFTYLKKKISRVKNVSAKLLGTQLPETAIVDFWHFTLSGMQSDIFFIISSFFLFDHNFLFADERKTLMFLYF